MKTKAYTITIRLGVNEQTGIENKADAESWMQNILLHEKGVVLIDWIEATEPTTLYEGK